MGTHRPRRRAEVGARTLNSSPAVVRVRPDVAAIDRTFDYAVPELWSSDGTASSLTVGSRVRVELHGRRVAGWVVELDPEPVVDVELRPLRKWSGHGPSAELLDLCSWVARRWAGQPARALRTASPPKNVYRLAAPTVTRRGGAEPWATACFEGPGRVVRLAPASDRWPIVEAALERGNPLFLVPTRELAERLAARLRRSGASTALLPDDWARAASGAAVVGTRAAALGPAHELGSIVVFDEHDEAYREERAPTWHAREVAIERARRSSVPCVLVSPTPSAEAARSFSIGEPSRADEHAGWAQVEVIDRRDEAPGRLGLFSAPLASMLDAGRVACVLNRTGRVRLLACNRCGELTRCDRCGAASRQLDETTLSCGRCGAERPLVCAECGGARLKNVVLGVGRAREELAALLGEPVGEWTSAGADQHDARVVIGTEALLRHDVRPRWATIVFLDFDQHLSARRQRADQEAMSMLVLASRQLGTRADRGRIVVQTRQPAHRVIVAARRGDLGQFTAGLVEQSERMGWPPARAQAEVSGPGAAPFIERLGLPVGLDVLGPNDDSYMVRADEMERLLDELARVDRGGERLRIAVS